MEVLDVIGALAAAFAVWLVVSATRGDGRAVEVERRSQVRRLLLAAAISGFAGLLAVWQFASVGNPYATVVTGFVAGATLIAASVVWSTTKSQARPVAESVLPRSRFAGCALFLVRAGLALGVLVTLVVFAAGERRNIDDRVAIERGWNENGPLPKKPGERQYYGFIYHDQVHLTLTLATPRRDSICPLGMRAVPGQPGAYEERPSRCAAGRELSNEFGGEPIAAIIKKDVYAPPGSVSRLIDATILTGLLLYLLAALSVERLISRAAVGRPFDRVAVRWVRLFVVMVGAIIVVLPVLADIVVGRLADRYLPGLDTGGWSISLGPLVLVIVLGTLAEVWRRGAVLQAEADGTV